ncbi:MAG: PQQ-binding-like beta-propeller repeat protein [Pirellulales bacterium]|nr:PQQ-binding-like beta-propeller repeat protein [Pirellulales bacterium]
MTSKRVGPGLLRASVVICLLLEPGGLAVNRTAPPLAASPADHGAEAQRILETTATKGGLVVHLGCRDGKLTAALLATNSYLVHGLDRDPANVEAARRHVQSLGLYGKVSIDQLAGNRLPYVDNLVNLLVVEEPGHVPADEILRVLAPGGAACVKQGNQWTKQAKPRTDQIDEWNQYLHDAGNNAVAHDSVVGPPRHLQWICGPDWSRHHDHMASLSALVSAGGRIFYIMDEGPREAILLPAQWSLIARDAFNGTLLWKQPIDQWNTHLWPLKSGPNQLPRRLVAVGDRVYVTLGIDAPVSRLDAITGTTLRTYAGTDHTDEILESNGTLFLLVAQGPNQWKDYLPNSTYVWDNTRRANAEWAWDEAARWVMAIEPESGRVLWKTRQRVAPLTLAANDKQVFCFDGEKVVSLDRNIGRELWHSEPVTRKSPFPTGYGPTLVVQQGVVLLSVENKSMTAFSADDGKKLWTAEHHRGGHASPDDLLVIDGLVWSGAVANGADSGVFTGRDLRTGEVRSEFPPDVQPDWFHHRCYRSRATDKYFIASRTGIEFIDLKAKHWDINHWVRGGCLYGFMPANGLMYVPPHACGCFLESKLFGFNALAAESATRKAPREVPEQDRLQRGPAYTESEPSIPHSGSRPSTLDPRLSSDWPTYRHDGRRSGSVKTAVPVDLNRLWGVELGGKLSSLTVAGGRLYLAAVDAHTVHALDAETGKKAWSFLAGARVDSPPTIHEGRVLFGSADGWVYCLRAADGELIWRYRVAPVDRRLIAYEQLESAWPVSGSVLVEKNAVWCVAGRSAFLDGGMRLVRLDPGTGRKLSETVLDDRDPATGEPLQAKIVGQDMPVALRDILSCDDRSVYMRSQAFDFEGTPREVAPVKLGRDPRRRGAAVEPERAEHAGDHLFSRSGFLDDSWFFRSYWIYGSAVDGNYGGWLLPGHFAPSGRLIVFDERSVYGFDRKPEYLCNASVQEYYLYGADREVSEEAAQRVRAATGRINAASQKKSASSSDWALRKKFSLGEQNVANFRWAEGSPPIQARAMVLAGDTLLVAGPPDVVDEEEALRNPINPEIRAKLEAQAAALKGRMGGQLLAISAKDGKLLRAYQLGAMPTFDAMAAADGKLYLTTVGGKVLCLGADGTKMPAIPDAGLAPLDISVKETPVEAVAGFGPSLAGQFDKVVTVQVTASLAAGLAYHVRTSDKAGFAVKKLSAPIDGKVRLKVRMRLAADGNLKNGFLLFGDGPEDAALVKCGLRYAMSKAVVIQGAFSGGKTSAETFEPREEKTYELDVTVDLAAGQVAMHVDMTTITATLDRPMQAISHVGYGVLDAAMDFGPIEVSVQ